MNANFEIFNPHIGAIYGDSITLERADKIYKRLEAKGFASTNIVLGIGSYTYQGVTRDTNGFAMKSTGVIINGVEKPIYKNPITDSGTKKSAKGFLKVIKNNDNFQLVDNLLFEDIKKDSGELKPIFVDGVFVEENIPTYQEIRNNITDSLNTIE